MNQVLYDVTNAPTELTSELWPLHSKEPKATRNNPYAVKIIPDDAPSSAEIFSEMLRQAYEASKANQVQKAVVQFKCHKGEYTTSKSVTIGEYVIVEGDRGIDIGVVVSHSYMPVSSGAPAETLFGSASQKEVDYWATGLKEAEFEALQICRQQITNLKLDMNALQAEYQYDKKKLTIYYAAPERVEYEALTKELFRQFGCRIWLVKVERDV